MTSQTPRIVPLFLQILLLLCLSSHTFAEGPVLALKMDQDLRSPDELLSPVLRLPATEPAPVTDIPLPALRMERTLAPPAAASNKEADERPVFVKARRIQGTQDSVMEAVDEVELRAGNRIVWADRLKYYKETNEAEVAGRVMVEQGGDIIEGSNLKINLDTKKGSVDYPSFSLDKDGGRGSACSLKFEGEYYYRLRKADYTTCPFGNNDWKLEADTLEIDNKEKVGTARKAKLTFKGIPIAYTPWANFSFSGERKSGLLAPVYGTNARTGFELTLPFYWNIAPNYDATISVRGMSKRGVMIQNEFRYLEQNFNGMLFADILPVDLNTDKARHRISFGHNHNLGYGLNARLDYNRVSDDAFFRDLGNSTMLTSRTNLVQQGLINYNTNLGEDGTLNFNAMVQRFQTLQDPRAPIIEPYKRLPQLTVNAIKPAFGFNMNFLGSWTNFSHPTLVSGNRLVLYPTLSYPLQNAFAHVTPKIGLHHTRYDLEDVTSARGTNMQRTVPIFSLDSGLVFERPLQLGKGSFTQTIEPRAFYVYAPYRNQQLLPNFDSAIYDLNFAQLISENRFSGQDRINDANRLALIVSSRLIEQQSGMERLRVSVGQLINFQDQRVQLLGPSQLGVTQIANRKPDFIAAITGHLTPTIRTDTSWQFDQSKAQTEVIRSAISYQPELGKVLNLGYRFTRNVLEQVDFSTQWPLTNRWQAMGRINYSLRDKEILEGLAGLEYNSCCWSLRFVLQHLTTATQRTTTAVFVQLELNGLMQIGSNPLNVLQRSIPGYTRTRDYRVDGMDAPLSQTY